MKISIGSDHAGFKYKEQLKAFLTEAGHEVVDCGTDSDKSTDYPLFIIPAAEAVAKGECERGIVLGGSGNGEAIAANKVKGVRCALCWNSQTAEFSRRHNDSNVLSIGQRMTSIEIAIDILKIWLETPFEGGRHKRRIDELSDYEAGRGLNRKADA
ncbi:MAG: ribose-5-phosphate isomerase [Chthoniobacterales bacterium]